MYTDILLQLLIHGQRAILRPFHSTLEDTEICDQVLQFIHFCSSEGDADHFLLSIRMNPNLKQRLEQHTDGSVIDLCSTIPAVNE